MIKERLVNGLKNAVFLRIPCSKLIKICSFPPIIYIYQLFKSEVYFVRFFHLSVTLGLLECVLITFKKNQTSVEYSDVCLLSSYSLLYFLLGKFSFIELINGLNFKLGNLAFLNCLI